MKTLQSDKVVGKSTLNQKKHALLIKNVVWKQLDKSMGKNILKAN